MRRHSSSSDSSIAARPSAAANQGTRNDWVTLKTLFPYLWAYKLRVSLALAFLIGAKVANVGVPVVLKRLIDSLTISPGDPKSLMVLPLGILVAYGVLRLCTTLFTELREFLEQLYPSAPEPPPRVDKRPCYAIDVSEPIFATLRDDYGNFDRWFTESCQRGQREAFVVDGEDGLAAICVLKDEDEDELLIELACAPASKRAKLTDKVAESNLSTPTLTTQGTKGTNETKGDTTDKVKIKKLHWTPAMIDRLAEQVASAAKGSPNPFVGIARGMNETDVINTARFTRINCRAAWRYHIRKSDPASSATIATEPPTNAGAPTVVSTAVIVAPPPVALQRTAVPIDTGSSSTTHPAAATTTATTQRRSPVNLSSGTVGAPPVGDPTHGAAATVIAAIRATLHMEKSCGSIPVVAAAPVLRADVATTTPIAAPLVSAVAMAMRHIDKMDIEENVVATTGIDPTKVTAVKVPTLVFVAPPSPATSPSSSSTSPATILPLQRPTTISPPQSVGSSVTLVAPPRPRDQQIRGGLLAVVSYTNAASCPTPPMTAAAATTAVVSSMGSSSVIMISARFVAQFFSALLLLNNASHHGGVQLSCEEIQNVVDIVEVLPFELRCRLQVRDVYLWLTECHALQSKVLEFDDLAMGMIAVKRVLSLRPTDEENEDARVQCIVTLATAMRFSVAPTARVKLLSFVQHMRIPREPDVTQVIAQCIEVVTRAVEFFNKRNPTTTTTTATLPTAIASPASSATASTATSSATTAAASTTLAPLSSLLPNKELNRELFLALISL